MLSSPDVAQHPDGSKPRDRRRRERLNAILEAAAPLFARRGFAGTSMADIAEAVDLSPKALYYYFPSKQAIFEEVLHHLFEFFEPDALAEARKQWIDLTLDEALAASAVHAIKEILAYADLLRISFTQSLRGNRIAQARHDHYMRNWLAHVEVLIREHTVGDLSDRAIRVLATEIVDALFGALVDAVL